MYETNNLKHQKKLVEVVQKYEASNKHNKWNDIRDELNKMFKEETNKETWRSRYRFLGDEYKLTKNKDSHAYAHNHDKEERLIAYLKKECTLDFLCEMLDMKEIELLGYIQKLQMEGREIQNRGNSFVLSTKILPREEIYKLYEGELKEFSFCVVSDTHLCNKKQQLTLLNKVYDECLSRGITKVLHCGDITDGQSNRPEQIYELFCYGADEQAQYVIDNYPKRDGITTYFITGNHDGWLYKKAGIDIGKTISSNRPDMVYLGNQKARVLFNKCKIDLFHPLDGSSYAKSYSGQKTIESMRGGSKPNIMFTGHHHKAVYFVDRNVHYCEVPCLCEATNFIEGKRLENTIGAIFPTMKIDDLGNVITFTPETMIFYNTIENDYDMPDKKSFRKEYQL